MPFAIWSGMQHRHPRHRHATHPGRRIGWASLHLALLAVMAVGAPMVTESLAAPAIDRSHRGGHAASAVPARQTRWYFAEGAQGFFDTFVLVANSNPTPANLTVTFLTESAGPLSRRYVVAAQSRFTVATSAIPELAGRSFSIVVDADQPIIAERAMYFGSDGQAWEGGHATTGVAQPSSSWFHAEGATGGFFDTYVLLANPNQAEVAVTMSYLLATGETLTKTHTIAPNSRLTVNLESEDPALQNAAVSTRVTADLPIVSERAMYWPGDASSWREGHTSFGMTETHTAWGVAEGRLGGTSEYETYLLVANSDSTAADVRVTFLREGGGQVVRSFEVAPSSRFTIDVQGAVPELSNDYFAAMVESTNGTPIVVERSIYWQADGQPWAGGNNAPGTRLP